MCPALPGGKAPLPQRTGIAPLPGRTGDAPPIFFLKHQKENAPCTVEKKKCWAQNRHVVPFLLKTWGPNKRLPGKLPVKALGAGPALLNLSAVSPRPGIAKPG